MAAATASVVAAQQARASVIYVPYHGVVPAGTVYDFDVDGDAIPDLRIDATSFPVVVTADPLGVFLARIMATCTLRIRA